LQCEAGWYVDATHDTAAPQVTVAAAIWQAPLPLQAPVFPHGGLAGHCPAGALEPAGTSVQVPRLSARLHARQVPQLPALQHTPSMQNPLVHCPPALQAAPSGRSPMQAPPLQKWPLVQSASPVQAVRQDDAPQT